MKMVGAVRYAVEPHPPGSRTGKEGTMATNGRPALALDVVAERVAAVEDAAGEVAADQAEHDVRLQRIEAEVAAVVTALRELHEVVRRQVDECAAASGPAVWG
jgi:hypothetical protein